MCLVSFSSGDELSIALRLNLLTQGTHGWVLLVKIQLLLQAVYACLCAILRMA